MNSENAPIHTGNALRTPMGKRPYLAVRCMPTCLGSATPFPLRQPKLKVSNCLLPTHRNARIGKVQPGLAKDRYIVCVLEPPPRVDRCYSIYDQMEAHAFIINR